MMIDLLYFLSLALILSSQAGDADPFEEGYPCMPNRRLPSAPTKLNDMIELHCGGYFYLDTMHKFLAEYEQDTYRGIQVAELLALEDVTEAKCTLDELERRRYYRALHELKPNDCLARFIAHYQKELAKFCNVRNGRLHQEAVAATDADRDVIQEVISVGKLEHKTELTSSRVKKASKRYIKSKAGTKDFVKSAHRLRILDACNHVRYVRELVWGDNHPKANRNLFADAKICRVYVRDYGKKVKGKLAKASEWMGSGLKKAGRVVAAIYATKDEDVYSYYRDRYPFFEAADRSHNALGLLKIMRFVLFIPTAIFLMSYISTVVFKRLILHAAEIGKRDAGDERYKIYPIE